MEKGIPFICENPKRSLMWLTEPFLGLPPVCKFQFVHACMCGSKRRKSTALLMNFQADNLRAECDGKHTHTHLPWGMVDTHDGAGLKFSTSLETEYPHQFCKQLVLAFTDFLQTQGKLVSQSNAVSDQLQKMGAGTQPRGIKSPLLLGEFKFKVTVKSKGVQIPATIGQDVHFPFQGIPVDAKLISSREFVEMGKNGEKMPFNESTFGVFWSQWEFLDRALRIEHPLDSPQLVDPSNLRAICFIRDHTAAEVTLFRTKQLRRFTKRAAELSSDEAKLKDTLNPDVRAVLADKRLLLFKEMAQEANVGDEHLFEELVRGFSLTGTMPESKQFPAKLKPAMISIKQLKDSAVWSKKI